MGLLDQEYQYDTFVDEDSAKLAGEYTLEKYKKFIEGYAQNLREIEEAIDESLTDLWSATEDPIALFSRPYEQSNALELVKTDNPFFNKIIIVFAHLCGEVKLLEEELLTDILPSLALHGENLTGDDDEDDGDIQLQMGKLLQLLKDTCTFVRRCYAVTRNIVHQLAMLYSKKTNKKGLFQIRGVHFQLVFERLGLLMTLLVKLEEVIKHNRALTDGWTFYKRMVKNVKNDPGRFDTDMDTLRQLDKDLQQIESDLFEGIIYQNCVEQVFDHEETVSVTDNNIFQVEFLLNIRTIFDYLKKTIGGVGETDQRHQFVGLCCLYGLYFTLYNDQSDKKLFQAIWGMHRTIPIIHLYGNAHWFPANFLADVVPEMLKFTGKENIELAREKFLVKLDNELPRVSAAFGLQVNVWMVRMESNLSKSASITDVLNNRMALFTQGIVLAYNIGHVFKTVMGLHTELQRGITSKLVHPLCELLEFLKAIEFTYFRRSRMIGENVSHMIQQISLSLQRTFMPIREQLEGNKKMDNSRIDTLVGVSLVLDMLDGSASDERRVLTSLGLAVTLQKGFIKDKGLADLEAQLRRLDLICTLGDNIKEACNTYYLYWSRTLLPAYFKKIYDTPAFAHRIPYMLTAMRDAHTMLTSVVQVDKNVLIDQYKDEVGGYVDEYITTPLCTDVETNLRYNVHANLLIDELNPFKMKVKDLAYFFNIRPILFFEKTIDFRQRVAHYLDTTFYKLTTVSLYDWRTYEEMRNLAWEKYNLKLTDVHLPGQNTSQGLDVLQIMRNIHIFVTRFNYNLNNQVFIEEASDSKTLNTISITQIANSIRTHGTGVMNTAVNYTYGYLQQKFSQMSQFLFDDHIKSPLLKDMRYYKKNRESLDNIYPFERADKFNREIRKLGLIGDMSYLDQFRTLVTEIGNAMGYVRMIRNGGLHHCARAIKFVPDITVESEFQTYATGAGLSVETQNAARLLDSHVETLSQNFAEGTEYFQILVDVFAKEFRTETNDHLTTFHAVIPPLTINYIEHILNSKERLIKKNKEGASFTDDGFAIGIAYILKTLDQTEQFDALHWFKSVQAKYDKQEKQFMEDAKKGKKKIDKKEREMAALTMKRLETFKKEFELLYFTFDGARVFFRE